jgi:hypothetical protein
LDLREYDVPSDLTAYPGFLYSRLKEFRKMHNSQLTLFHTFSNTDTKLEINFSIYFTHLKIFIHFFLEIPRNFDNLEDKLENYIQYYRIIIQSVIDRLSVIIYIYPYFFELSLYCLSIYRYLVVYIKLS